MAAFSIGIMADSLRLPFEESLKKCRELGADGVQLYAVDGEMSPEAQTPETVALKRRLLDSMPLYDVVEKVYHEKIRVAEEEFFASVARPSDAHLLDIAENAPVLDLVRTTYNMSNEIIEYTLSVARADQFKYKVLHQRA